jgi:2-C-methyl-D-erythritol 4-phosphate cytidylyltransferase
VTPDSYRTTAAVLAGGTGRRSGLPTPKQLAEVAGKPIIEHSVEVLHASDLVDEIIVLMTPGYTDEVARLLGNRYPKLTGIYEGGASRNESTQRALDAIADEEGNVLLHDAARPLLDQRIIQDCVDALKKYQAVAVAIPTTDTIVDVRDDVVVSVPDRSTLRRAQTPQGFRLSTIRAAYKRAWQDPNFISTDDCTVVLKYLPEVSVHVVAGSERNIKITHSVDIALATTLYQSGSN